MVRKSVCKHTLKSEVDNDGDFYVGILVDDHDLPCFKLSVAMCRIHDKLLSNSTPK